MSVIREKLNNLFHPGSGKIPPHLTGREQEQNYFHKCLNQLLEKTSPDQDMIIYGPRGNGKTALLRYLKRQALEMTNGRVDIAWTTPRKANSLEGLVSIITGSDKNILKRLKGLGVSVNFGVASFNAEFDVPRATGVIEEILQEKSSKSPFILIMDEAHTLTPKMAGILLDAGQNLRGEDCPFFLILAGTPNLEKILNLASATFWDKSNVFPLGRLTAREAKFALTIPLKSCQITCAEESAEEVAYRAHNYPYFLQIWGDCIASQLLETGSNELTMEIISGAEHIAINRCTTIYTLRYNELSELGLIPLATDIAKTFKKTEDQYIPVQQFEKLIDQSLTERGLPVNQEIIRKNIQQLSDIGYIWKIDVTNGMKDEIPLLCYEPGIPSLMKFIRRQSRP
ncbi:MAG: AAA family ATPase [Gammaproteobacteria bacterium]|nr:AAA family ATPase [Gammaproteobacteria bacterium]MCY4219122.1 AAA family ATPase [Gammaproteobacteria bacterium]MCY4274107.1 AAA family ATPase [Gammaproteobacteria bacterium]